MTRTPKVPPLVGKREAAELLGCHPNNLGRDVPELPASLQKRIPGMAVGATPLYTRSEVTRLATQRATAKRRRDAAAAKAAAKKK